MKITAKVTTDSTGKAAFTFKPKNLVRWAPGNSKLYQLELSFNDQKVTDYIEFLTIETLDSNILLNGKSIFYGGICIQEENSLRGGRAFST